MASRVWHILILVALIAGILPAATAAVPAQPPRTESSPGAAVPAWPEAVQVTLPAGPATAPAGSAVASGPYRPRSAATYTLTSRGGVHQAKVLLVEADSDTIGDCPIRTLLQAYGDLGAIDLYDAQAGTPALAELLGYQVVLVWSNFPFHSATELGNVLADYVDAGGRVVDLLFAMGTHGWQMQGRFIDEGYTAMNGTALFFTNTCLGSYNGSHPIMAGVTNVCEYYRMTGTYLTPGSTEIAQWSDGLSFVAAKDNRTVVSVNGYVGLDHAWTGQMADVVHNAILWLTSPSILHITTTDTSLSVQLALQQLHFSYDLHVGLDWTGIDFSPYDIVIVGMDGGTISAASIQKVRTDVIGAGKRLFFLGGTCWLEFATAVNDYLTLNDTGNYCWSLSGPPQWTITNPSNLLAHGLPSPYNFANNQAGYYQIRVNDPAIRTVAVNGDGFAGFFYKTAFGGQEAVPGDFTWYIDSVLSAYWTDPADFAFLKQLIYNVIGSRYHTYVPLVGRQMRPLFRIADGDSLPDLDQDVYRFTATPGTAVSIWVDTVSLDTAFDIEACLSTEDSSASCFRFGDDNMPCTYPPPGFACPRFRATLPDDGDGVYYLLIESGSGNQNYAGPVGHYHASVGTVRFISPLTLIHNNQPGTFQGK